MSIFSKNLLVIFLCGRVLIMGRGVTVCSGKRCFSLMLLLEQVDRNEHGHKKGWLSNEIQGNDEDVCVETEKKKN